MFTKQQTRILGPQFAPSWHRPQFRYIDPVPGAEAGTPGDKSKDDDLGFPKDTPVDDMTPEQQAAYWKNQSKTQQKIAETEKKKSKAYEKFGTVEDLQSAADAAEQARLAALDDNEKAIEAARTAGKAEGAQEASQGASKLLGAAITGMLIAHTKGAQETFEDARARVAGAIEFADLTKFVGENGDLDAEKVQTFAKSIGSADSGGNDSSGFDLLGAMQRQTTPTPGGTGSVAAMEQQVYDRLKPKQ